jgi:hypothetical protein
LTVAPKVPALAHLLIGQPDLAEALMRALALKGQLPQYIEGELNASITAFDLADPEYLWLRRNVRLSQGITIAAVAAQFAQFAFAPVANAGRSLAVVEQLILANPTAATQTFLVDSQPNIALGAAPNVPKSALDDRAIPFNQLQPTPAFGLGNAQGAVAITGAGALSIAVGAGQTVILPLNWIFTNRVVLPTPAPSLLLVQHSVVNLPLTAGIVWRERALLATEAT